MNTVALPCQRCGQSTGRVRCYLDTAQTVRHATARECIDALKARVAELDALILAIQDEHSEEDTRL